MKNETVKLSNGMASIVMGVVLRIVAMAMGVQHG